MRATKTCLYYQGKEPKENERLRRKVREGMSGSKGDLGIGWAGVTGASGAFYMSPCPGQFLFNNHIFLF